VVLVDGGTTIQAGVLTGVSVRVVNGADGGEVMYEAERWIAAVVVVLIYGAPLWGMLVGEMVGKRER
jgi:hypothetical protein